MWINEMKNHLTEDIIPFWKSLRDDEFGGYYGYCDDELNIDKKADKGCILHSRILWFFSNAYTLLKDETLLDEANHAYNFIKEKCIDREYGGIYWTVSYDGKVVDDTKHTYNQAFCIYAMASFYEASKKKEALDLSYELYDIIEQKCTDSVGFLEGFNRFFEPVPNDKLSENGIIAEKTMNTLLHVFEAYTELYRVTGDKNVAKRLYFIMDMFVEKIYNPILKRQEVFFDKNLNTLIDLHSYGHDIESSWLCDRGFEVLKDKEYEEKVTAVTKELAKYIYKRAYVESSVLNECEAGIDDTNRIWWVQAEAVIGFYNAYEKDPTQVAYLEAAKDVWEYIKKNVIHKECGEWHAKLNDKHEPVKGEPIVEPWKCPYHNGRMCIEIIRRNS